VNDLNFPVFVMRSRYAVGLVCRLHERSDPNGIRTRVTAVKGRCPGPLDDRVTKAAQYQNCQAFTQGKLPNCFRFFVGDGGWRRGYRLGLSS
jgi:hypothetical protein